MFSANGRHWIALGSTFSRAMTPTHMALIVTANGGGSAVGMANFLYIRRTDTDPT